MSKKQKNFFKMNYPLANCDTCVAFMEAIGNLLCADGVCGIVSQNACQERSRPDSGCVITIFN